jgi:2-polyprenyl-3-methyl-5-hydroxy-6-metoxy-1,4-benzoquinol methylase
MSDLREVPQREACSFPSEWYELGNEEHFWFQWRLGALVLMLRELHVPLNERLRVLDVGCGHSILRRQLEAFSLWVMDGTDLNEAALKVGGSSRGKVMCYDIEDKSEELYQTYDVLFLFDILEHIQKEEGFLSSALFHLKPSGWLFINVPAIECLYSYYDEIAGHIRRYDKAMLFRATKHLPLVIKDMRYWGLSMIPVLLLRKIILVKGKSKTRALRMGFKPPSQGVHAILKSVMRFELSVLRNPGLGTSLLVAAKKTGS